MTQQQQPQHRLQRHQSRHRLLPRQLLRPCLLTSPRAHTQRHSPILVGQFSRIAPMSRRWLLGARASTS
jgi:hypothetical protein